MKNLMNRRGLKLVQALAALILALTPFVLRPVCNHPMKNGMPMPCHYSGILITLLAGFIVAFYLLAFWMKKKRVDLIADVLTLVFLAIAYLVPSQRMHLPLPNMPNFGLCKSPEMSCQQSFHWVTILVLILLVLAVVAIILGFVSKEESR